MKGTPEQSAEVRHRRKVWLRTGIITGLAFIVSAIALERVLDPQTHLAYVTTVGFALAIGFLVFTISYWRCPVCRQHFVKGSHGRHCHNCGTTFDP